MLGNPDAHCIIIGYLSFHAGNRVYDASSIKIELLAEDITRKYQKDGVIFYSVEEINDTKVLDCLADAIEILNRVPTLAATVSMLAKSLHVIKPKDNNHDVSFSEPHIPFSVFVSVPFKRRQNDALRVAEGILHEAMHLQLTFVEQIIPLVKHGGETYYSPWRGECRTAQGVLHALYVFQVIDQFLEHLISTSSFDKCTNYMHNRRKQISEQIAQVYSFQHCPDLTLEGQALVRRLVLSNSTIAVT